MNVKQNEIYFTAFSWRYNNPAVKVNPFFRHPYLPRQENRT